LDRKSGTQLIKRYRGTIGKGARNELLLILYETSVNFKIYRSLQYWAKSKPAHC
jgi:hypothetical protein